jgi:hypothetical protein
MIIGITGKAGAGKSTAADVLVQHFNFVAVGLADPLKRICRDVFDFSDDQLWAESEKRNAPDKRYPRGRQLTQDRVVCAECKEEYIVPRGNSMRCPKCGYNAWKSSQYGIVTDVFLTPRFALQQFGTEWARNCYEDVWVDHAMRTAKKLMTGAYIYHQRLGLQELLVRSKIRSMADKTPTGVVIPDVRFKNEVDVIRKAGGRIWRITRSVAGLEGDAGSHVSETEQDSIEADITINGLDIDTFIQAVKDTYVQEMTRNIPPVPLPEIDHPFVDLDNLDFPDTTEDGKWDEMKTIHQQVLSCSHPGLDYLHALMEQRQKDVDVGKIEPFDVEQQDVAPFERW